MAENNDEHPSTMLPMMAGLQQTDNHPAGMLPMMAGIQRIDSGEYHLANNTRGDTTSPNTPDSFILDALMKPVDRIFLLNLEMELETFIKDHSRFQLDLPPMNSYQRLMVHKAAPYFYLYHSRGPSGQSVCLCKTPRTALPVKRFADLVEDPMKQGEQQVAPKFQIMRRERPSNEKHARCQDKRAEPKESTYEERKAAYEEARARIFQGFESEE